MRCVKFMNLTHRIFFDFWSTLRKNLCPYV